RVHQLDRLCPGSVAGRGLTHQRSRQPVQCPIPRGCVGFRPLSQPAAAGKDPTKDLTFKNNTLSVVTDGSAGAGGLSQGFNDMATTDFSGDNANAYNFGLATDATGLYNSDFDGANAFSAEVGTSFWSTEGNAATSNAAVGQPGGNYGVIQGFETGYLRDLSRRLPAAGCIHFHGDGRKQRREYPPVCDPGIEHRGSPRHRSIQQHGLADTDDHLHRDTARYLSVGNRRHLFVRV